MTRAERLNERFKTIQATLTELYGRERSFGAASAAWLMALQYMHKQSLLSVAQQSQNWDTWPVVEQCKFVAELEEEMQNMLQSFHAELCEHLGIKQLDVFDLARSFKQVIDDVCHQGG